MYYESKKNPVQINEQDLYLFADFVVLVRVVVLVRGFGSCPRGFGSWFWFVSSRTNFKTSQRHGSCPH